MEKLYLFSNHPLLMIL